jgi:hypothetical protein
LRPQYQGTVSHLTARKEKVTHGTFRLLLHFRVVSYGTDAEVERKAFSCAVVGRSSNNRMCYTMRVAGSRSDVSALSILEWPYAPIKSHRSWLRTSHTSTTENIPPPHTHLLYIICRICNKCICSISTGSWMNYAQWRNSYIFVHLGIILILVRVFGYVPGWRNRYSDWLWAGRPRGRSSSPGRVKIVTSPTVQTGSGVHSTSYTMGTGGSFPGVKRTGHEAHRSPPTSAEVKKNVDLCIHSPIRLHGVVLN